MSSIAGACPRAFNLMAWTLSLSVWFSFAVDSYAAEDDSLHARIDQLSDQEAVGPRGAVVDDLTFLRRVTLDLTGRIPSIDDAREFLADTSPDKRTRAIDRLMSSPDFYRNLAVVFDVMVMERRGDKHVKSVEFRAWLQEFFQQKKPYNELVHDLLAADGTDEKQRAAAAFFLERDVEPNLLTREIGRMFLGIDLQCAQCHDHPLIDDYHQTDYFGTFAFVNQLAVFRPDAKKPALIGETVSGQSEFKSVFTAREAVTSPRLPGEVEIVEPVFAVGNEYSIRPAKDVRPVPKFSRQDKLAELISSGQNPLFRRNIANRLWAMMLGRGLVHPVDQHHSENPATNPALLDLLGDEFAKSNYDVSKLLREIALSQTYQRSWKLPADLSPSVEDAAKVLAGLNAQVTTADTQVEAKQVEALDALAKLDEALAEAKPLRAALQKVMTTAQAEATKLDTATATVQSNQTKFDQKQAVAAAVRAVAASAQAALASIPDDKELAASAKTLDEKAVKLEAEATKLKTTLEASVKAAADADAKLAEANKPVEPARAALAPVEAKVRESRASHVALREEIRKTREVAQHAQRRARFLETVVTLDAAEKSLADSEPMLASVSPMSRAAQTEYAAAEKARQSSEAQMKAATEMSATSDAELAELQKQLTNLQLAATSVGGSVTAANEALKALQNDTDLTQAVVVLDAAQKRIGGDLAGLQAKTDTQQAVSLKAREQLATSKAAFDAATSRASALKTRSDELTASAAKLTEQVQQAKLTINDSSDKVIQEAASHFNVAVVEPLTPEQLGWSILQATGQLERQRATEMAKLDKAKPLTPEEQKDAAKVAERNREADAATYTSLSATVGRFVNLFASQKGQPQDAFFATVEQALFFANGGEIRSWLTPSGDNLTGRLLKLEEPNALAEELYVSIFTRPPTTDEVTEVSNYLEQRKEDRSAAIQEIAWALVTSIEFRFNR
ncbi:MAG: DUF1549 domain-containing protein [Rhodopirellula sp.]|nr:DUF1549 domain-containing protein [Rhodopirellula sp.]